MAISNNNRIWSTKAVNETLVNIQEGIPTDMGCFWNQDIDFKAPNINFEMTQDELEEWVRCSQDVIYFANKYGYAMTDDGIANIKLRDYQEKILKQFQDNRFIIMLAARQIGKCSIYQTNINILNDTKTFYDITSLGELYNKTKGKLTIFEKIKKILWNNYTKRSLFKNLILFLIQTIESIEYRKLNLNEDDVSKKILSTLELESMLVKTNTGYSQPTHIHKTQPYHIYKIVTSNGKRLECADLHILIDENMNEIVCKDLKIGYKIQTRDGIDTIAKIKKSKFKVSMFDISLNDNNHLYYTNDILSHNTITSSLFLAWYICFNFDKNILIVANKQITTEEIVDKTKVVLQNLPFYMKPGVYGGGVRGMRFDNGCRIISQATTKTAAIGFTIHLLYADEFAHIHSNFLNDFYRSIFPTLSSSLISRIIISSTPNGLNLFYKIYKDAINKKNTYHPIRVDWWEVPGKDEKWKQEEISNLGSEELFQQEYGNQFLSTSSTLLSSSTVKFLARIQLDFEFKEIYNTELLESEYEGLTWRNDINPNELDVVKYKYVVSIDLADGVGRDYTIMNIFRLEAMSPASIRTAKNFTTETDIFRLVQIGLYRSNVTSIENFSEIVSMLIFDIIGPSNITVVLEVNFKGHYLIEKISKHEEYYPEIFLHTYQTIKSKTKTIGIKLRQENKQVFCRVLNSYMKDRRIITYESETLQELQSFGIDDKGNYSGRGSHDDIAMTLVNLTAYFGSNDYMEHSSDIIDYISNETQDAIYNKLDFVDYNSSSSLISEIYGY